MEKVNRFLSNLTPIFIGIDQNGKNQIGTSFLTKRGKKIKNKFNLLNCFLNYLAVIYDQYVFITQKEVI